MRKLKPEVAIEGYQNITLHDVVPGGVVTEEWIKNAIPKAEMVQNAFANDSWYVKNAMTLLDNFSVRDSEKFCTIPVDILLWLRTLNMKNTERELLYMNMLRKHAWILCKKPDEGHIPVENYVVPEQTKTTCREGVLRQGLSSVMGLGYMFIAMNTALTGRDIDPHNVIDGFLRDSLPDIAEACGERQRSRIPSKNRRPSYQLICKPSDLLGTMLMCTAPVRNVVPGIMSIVSEASKKGQSMTFERSRVLLHKLLRILICTAQSDFYDSKFSAVMYAKKKVW